MIRFWAARRRVHILTVLALVVSLAGCESSPPAAPVTPNPGAEQDRGLPPVPPATPATPNPRADRDVGLRQVPHTGGLALVFAQPEFASQVLCQAIDKQDWEKVLGGRVARILSRPPIAGCTIAADTAEVFLSLRGPGPETYEQGKTIGGRPAEEHPGDIRTWIAITVSDSPRGRTSLTAEFHPKGPQPEASAKMPLLRRALETIVPVLTQETGELPEVAEDGTMAYTATPLTGDVLDLPVTIQNLQLCTLLQERLGVKVTKVSYPLGCSTETGSASFWSAETPLDGYPDSIADRPAKIGKGIKVRLRDDAWVDLVVTGDDAKAMAERIVPLLPR